MARLDWAPRRLARGHLRDRANVLFGCAAAAADQIEPAVTHEFLELPGQRCRCLEVAALFIRQARVRVAGDAAGRETRECAHVVRHEFGTRAAIEAHGEQMQVFERSPQRLDVLPGEHRAHRFDRRRDHHRNHVADFPRQAIDGQRGGLDVARVLASFKKQQIRAAVDQAARLLVVSVAQFAEADAASDADGLGRWPHRAGHKSRFRGGREFVGRAARELRRRSAQFVGARRLIVFAEHDRGATERIGLDNVRAGFQVFAMDSRDHVRPARGQKLEAAFEFRSAEIGRR